MPPERPADRNPRRRLRAGLLGVGLALLAFELALQVGAYALWRTAGRETHGGDGRRVVLCVGDSFTYGLGASAPEQSYPAQLQRALDAARPGVFHVVNAGRPGQSTAEVLLRLPGQLADHRPRHVLVLAGYNDRWRKPDPVDPATLAGPPEVETFPLRVRTIELAGRVLGAIAGGGPGAPAATDLLGSWAGPELRVTFRPEGICVVSGVEAAYRLDGEYVVVGTGAAELRLRFERRGDALWLGGATLPDGGVELARAAGPDDVARAGRRLVESDPTIAELDDAAVAEACAVLREHPEESPLWWRMAAAATHGVGREPLLDAVAEALRKLDPADPWRAGLLRIRSGLVAAGDPDGALAAVLEAALVDGAVDTVARALEARPQAQRRADFERAVARIAPPDADRARLEQMYARTVVPDSRVAAVLETHIERTVALCRAAGSDVAILTYPEREPVVDRAIRAGARRADLEAVDVAAAFDAALEAQPREELFVMDGHCSDAGYALVVASVLPHLLAAVPAEPR